MSSTLTLSSTSSIVGRSNVGYHIRIKPDIQQIYPLYLKERGCALWPLKKRNLNQLREPRLLPVHVRTNLRMRCMERETEFSIRLVVKVQSNGAVLYAVKIKSNMKGTVWLTL